MKSTGRYFLLTIALMALSYPMALADTLELKDGRLLEGDYVGGTRTTLRFQVENRVEVIPSQEVLALTFSNTRPSASGRASAPASERSNDRPITVAAGTRLVVRLAEGVDSKEDAAGNRFTAVLQANLEVNGRVVAPKGSTVYGRLTSAKKGGRAFGKAELQLELTDIVIGDQLHPIITGEYELTGQSQGTLKKTAIGAALGALLDGGDGAKKGAAAGLGLSLISKGKQVSLGEGTIIEFRLQQPLTMRV